MTLPLSFCSLNDGVRRFCIPDARIRFGLRITLVFRAVPKSLTLDEGVARLILKFILTGLGNWAPARKLIETGVKEAEDHGFWATVFPDQYMWDPSDLGVKTFEGIDSTLETWILLTHLASKTCTIRLGTWVTPIPLRSPGLLAKTVATLDVLSGGRAILGVGAGVTERMFEAYSTWDPPRTRVDKTEEGVDLILRLWKEPQVDFKSKHFRAKSAVLEPKPVQKPHPPLLFGGSGQRMLRLAGKFADICYIPPWNKMKHEDARKIVLEEAGRVGRSGKLKFAYAYTPLGPNQQYNRDEYGSKVKDAAEKGFDYFITAFNMEVAPWEVDPPSIHRVSEAYNKSLRDFAQSIIPSYN